MKRIIRSLTINIFALWLTSVVLPGFSYRGGFFTLFLAAFVLGLINLLLKPVIRFFLLPINLLTLGLLSWLINVFLLFILTLLVPQIVISSFNFPGFQSHGFIIPPFGISHFWALALASLSISIISGFLNWLC